MVDNLKNLFSSGLIILFSQNAAATFTPQTTIIDSTNGNTAGVNNSRELDIFIGSDSNVCKETGGNLAAILSSLGSPFQSGGSIGNTSFGITGSLPAFASTPTFNLGTLNGAATSSLQTAGNSSLSSIDTKLGSPFQAGGSIGNTTFAATQATAASLNATVVTTGGVTVAKDSSLTTINTTLGTPFQAGGSIGNTSFGISGALPAYASTPTFNLGSLNGAATNASLLTINTTLGSPFQAGGSIGNTSFGLSGTLPAFAATPSFKLQDGAGNAITSQISGSQRALDVGINVAGNPVDPRSIRALTSSDVVTAQVSSLPALPAGTNSIGTVVQTALVTGSISNNAAITTTASTFTAPANAVGFILEAESGNTANIRWAVGSTATASVGMLAEPGRDTGYIPLAANISVIAISGTQAASVQWVVR